MPPFLFASFLSVETVCVLFSFSQTLPRSVSVPMVVWGLLILLKKKTQNDKMKPRAKKNLPMCQKNMCNVIVFNHCNKYA